MPSAFPTLVLLVLLASSVSSMLLPRLPPISSLDLSTDYASAFVTMGKFVANVSLTAMPMMNPSCRAALLSVFSQPLATTESYNFIMYSGKKVNDLGDYIHCSRSPETTYFLMAVTSKTFGLSYGVCVPKDCQPADFDPLKASITSMIAEKIPGTDLEVHFWDLKQENKKMSDTGLGHTLFVTITCILLVVIFIATIRDIYYPSPETTGLKILSCFSAPKNIKSIFNTNNKVDSNLDILNGVRVFAMVWVIVGHAYTFEATSRVYNIEELVRTATQDFYMAFINVGTVSVDLFFCLSGFLAALVFSKLLEKSAGIVPVLLAYLKRYIRLLPLLLATFMILVYVQTTLKDEPFDPQIKNQVQNCKDYWYRMFFYVGNFWTGFEACMSWTWYLMNDMQFFIIAPAIVAIFLSSQVKGLLTIAGLILASVITQIYIFVTYELNSSLVKPPTNNYGDLYYNKPYCRIVTYLLGMLLYFLYSAHKKDDEESSQTPLKRLAQSIVTKPLLKYLMYLIGFIFLIIPLYERYVLEKYPEDWGQGFATYFEVTFRPMFTLGVIFIVTPSILGNGQILLNIFGHPMFSPLGKLTYGAYLFHPLVFMYMYWYTLNGNYFNHYYTWHIGMCVLFSSYFIAFVAGVLYEGPVIQLMNLCFNPSVKRVEGESETMLLDKAAN